MAMVTSLMGVVIQYGNEEHSNCNCTVSQVFDKIKSPDVHTHTVTVINRVVAIVCIGGQQDSGVYHDCSYDGSQPRVIMVSSGYDREAKGDKPRVVS